AASFPPAALIRRAARPSSSSISTFSRCSGVNCWLPSRRASDCADWMKPRARSVNFSISIIPPARSLSGCGLQQECGFLVRRLQEPEALTPWACARFLRRLGILALFLGGAFGQREGRIGRLVCDLLLGLLFAALPWRTLAIGGSL